MFMISWTMFSGMFCYLHEKIIYEYGISTGFRPCVLCRIFAVLAILTISQYKNDCNWYEIFEDFVRNRALEYFFANVAPGDTKLLIKIIVWAPRTSKFQSFLLRKVHPKKENCTEFGPPRVDSTAITCEFGANYSVSTLTARSMC